MGLDRVKLADLQEKAGLTNRQVAERAGIAHGTYTDMKNGRTTRPSLANVRAIAAAVR